ncbi:helix-turn-helix domain-containing protein [Streptomyces sp. NRRL F-5630]|uniref:helix-turn-helix transcriptional regulator n=1 Tax=Streptomyces sp. NRRL F-5630 TaxID=1463864 RepID=UPI003D75F691
MELESEAERVFIQQMKARRQSLDLTQSALAKRVASMGGALYQQTIAKLESGERSLKLSEADLLARALDTTIQDLLSPVAGLGLPRLTSEGLEAHLAQLMEEHQKAQEVAEMAKRDASIASERFVQARQEADYAEAEASRARGLLVSAHNRLEGIRLQIDMAQQALQSLRDGGE